METNDLKKIWDAVSEINKCIEDDDFICQLLNDLDKNHLRNYYKSDKEGPIVQLRKEVCKEILLDDITSYRLNEIVTQHKKNNPQAFKSWSNNFTILSALIVDKYQYLKPISDAFVYEIYEIFENKIGHVVWDFQGSRNQGQDHFCFAFYNNQQKNQSTGLQLFIDFKKDKIEYGIYEHSSKSQKVDKQSINDLNDFNKVIEFLHQNKEIILNDLPKQSDVETSDRTFISSAIHILKMNQNSPMSAREIWQEIERLKLYETSGKTPIASLNSIMLGSSKNSNIKNKSKNIVFECVGDNPIKFKLLNYVSERVKDSLISEGFLTIEKLVEILKKNNINIEI